MKNKDKQIEVADGHHVMAKQKGNVWIKICNNTGDLVISTLHYIILAPDLFHRLFLIIKLMNSGHTC